MIEVINKITSSYKTEGPVLNWVMDYICNNNVLPLEKGQNIENTFYDESYYGVCHLFTNPNPKTHIGLANMRHYTGQPKKAKVLYNRAIQLDPNYIECYNNLAEITATEGNHTGALDQMQCCLNASA